MIIIVVILIMWLVHRLVRRDGEEDDEHVRDIGHCHHGKGQSIISILRGCVWEIQADVKAARLIFFQISMKYDGLPSLMKV